VFQKKQRLRAVVLLNSLSINNTSLTRKTEKEIDLPTSHLSCVGCNARIPGSGGTSCRFLCRECRMEALIQTTFGSLPHHRCYCCCHPRYCCYCCICRGSSLHWSPCPTTAKTVSTSLPYVLFCSQLKLFFFSSVSATPQQNEINSGK